MLRFSTWPVDSIPTTSSPCHCCAGDLRNYQRTFVAHFSSKVLSKFANNLNTSHKQIWKILSTSSGGTITGPMLDSQEQVSESLSVWVAQHVLGLRASSLRWRTFRPGLGNGFASAFPFFDPQNSFYLSQMFSIFVDLVAHKGSHSLPFARFSTEPWPMGPVICGYPACFLAMLRTKLWRREGIMLKPTTRQFQCRLWLLS